MEYSSNAKGNLGVTLGAIGTGLSVLNGGVGLLSGGVMPQMNYATKDDLRYVTELAAKDSEIADLKATSAAETKMIEVYKQVKSEMNDLAKEVRSDRREQDAWNATQSVANAQMSSAIAVNQNSIASINNILNDITMLKVPNSAVCPGWGSVSVTPTATGTTFS